VLVVPNLTQLGEKLKKLEGLKLASFAAQLQGFATADAYVSAVMEQLGVDLRSREELTRAGIDSQRGAAVAIVSANRGYSVIAISDAARFKEAVLRLAQRRLGGAVETTREELGHAVSYFAHPGEAGSALAFVLNEGFALVATGDSVQELAGYASLSLPESLADAQSLSGALARLPASRDLYLHVPTTSRLAGYCGLADCTFSAELTPDAMLVRGDLPSPRSRDVLTFLDDQGGQDMISLLPSDAFLIARFSGDPRLLTRVWSRMLDRQAASSLDQAGFDLQSEVLSNLKPGAVAAISVAPTATFSEPPELDVRRTNPFRFVHLVALAAVKDASKAEQVLNKLPALAPHLGAKVEPAQHRGHKVFMTSYGQGQGVDFAQVGDKVVIAAPVQRLDDALARLAKGSGSGSGPPVDADLLQTLKGRPVAAVLYVPSLAQSIRALPSSAWGIGGFAIKATTIRWLDAIDDLRAVTAAVYAKDGALEVEVDLRFAKK
jgi:hypothetical protein